jgi:hypothetical protein
MRVLSILVSAAILCAASVPGAAYGSCKGSRCADAGGHSQLHGLIVPAKCRHTAPSGWGFYLRQRLRQDEATPLAIRDEPGGVTLYRDRR